MEALTGAFAGLAVGLVVLWWCSIIAGDIMTVLLATVAVAYLGVGALLLPPLFPPQPAEIAAPGGTVAQKSDSLVSRKAYELMLAQAARVQAETAAQIEAAIVPEEKTASIPEEIAPPPRPRPKPQPHHLYLQKCPCADARLGGRHRSPLILSKSRPALRILKLQDPPKE